MIAYVDSSVLLRLVLGQPGALREWKRVSRGIASGLVEVESSAPSTVCGSAPG